MIQLVAVLAALVAGLALGATAATTQNPALLGLVSGLEPIGTMWINAIRMTVMPLVVALLVTGVAAHDPGRIGRLGGRAVIVFLCLLLAGGLLALAVTPLAFSGLAIPPAVATGLQATAAAVAGPTAAGRLPSLAHRLVETIPANPLRAAAEDALLPLVVFTLVFAVGVARLDPAKRAGVVGLFQAVADAMLVVVRWVLAVAPLGIFALALGLGAKLGASALGALAHYIVTLSAVLFVYTLALYPLVWLLGRVPIGRFAAAAAPAQAVAISSRSSLAALPAMIAAARDKLAAPPVITGVALPLAVSIFRVNVPMAWVVGILFLSRLYGVPLDAGQLLGLLVTSTLISFSVPGIPSGSLFLLAPVLVHNGLPAEGVGILIAVDALPDIFKTTANVTSHLTAAALLGRGGDASPSSTPLQSP